MSRKNSLLVSSRVSLAQILGIVTQKRLWTTKLFNPAYRAGIVSPDVCDCYLEICATSMRAVLYTG